MMRNILQMSILLSILVLPVGAWSQYEQSPEANQPEMQSPAQDLMTAEGTLTKADPASMTVSIQLSDGSEQHFQYTDQTQVQGADGTVAGLANATGTGLRITFQESGGANLAIKIEVL